MIRTDFGDGKESTLIQESRIIRNAFYIQFAAYLFSELTHIIGNIVDGVIIGQYLGVESMAAFGIVSPMMVVFSIFGTIIATGSRNRFTRLLGEGKRQEAQGIFSLSLLLSIGSALLLMIGILLFAGPIAALLGASDHAASLLPKARGYLIGISFGLPALNAIGVLNVYLPIDNNRQLPMNASLVLTVTDIILDIVAVFILHGDTLMVGLVTSISQYAALAVLLLHLRRKNRILRFSFRNPPWREIPGIIRHGIPIGVCRVAYTVRVAFMNHLLAAAASASAIAAYSVYQQADDLLCAVTIGMADTVAVISGILMGEEDRPRMKRLLYTSIQATLIITMAVAVLTYATAPLFADLFLSDDAQALALAVRAVRAYAAGMPLYCLSLIYFNYFQGIGKNRLSAVTGLLSEAGFLMLTAWILSHWFPTDAVWFAFPVTQMLMIVYYRVVISCVSRRNGTRHMSLWDRTLLLPASFDVPDEDRMDLQITSMEDAKLLFTQVTAFCEAHGCAPLKTYHLSLAAEEMVGNVIRHGFTADRRKHSLDCRVLIKGDTCILRIRDDCMIFDPVKQLELLSDEDRFHHIGLRMIFDTAQEVQYICLLKLNNLLVRI